MSGYKLPKNRKAKSGMGFGQAIAAFVICLLLGGAGLGFVWQKDQIQQFAKKWRKLEHDLKDIRDANRQAADQLARLRSPAMLEQRVHELNLGLVQPEPEQILRLMDVPHVTPGFGERPTAKLDGELLKP